MPGLNINISQQLHTSEPYRNFIDHKGVYKFLFNFTLDVLCALIWNNRSYVLRSDDEKLVHGTARICKRLAVTGFEFGSKMAVPEIEGIVIAEENEDLLRDAWRADQDLIIDWFIFIISPSCLTFLKGEFCGAIARNLPSSDLSG